jgi:hypothetical protein
MKYVSIYSATYFRNIFRLDQRYLRGGAFKDTEKYIHAFNFWLCFRFTHRVAAECSGISEERTVSIFGETEPDGRTTFLRNVRTLNHHSAQNPKMTPEIYQHRPKNLKNYKVATLVYNILRCFSMSPKLQCFDKTY